MYIFKDEEGTRAISRMVNNDLYEIMRNNRFPKIYYDTAGFDLKAERIEELIRQYFVFKDTLGCSSYNEERGKVFNEIMNHFVETLPPDQHAFFIWMAKANYARTLLTTNEREMRDCIAVTFLLNVISDHYYELVETF